MRKILSSIFIFVLFLCFIVGCNNEKLNINNSILSGVGMIDTKANLQIGDMNAQTYEIISMTTLKNKIENDESFVLFGYQDGCYWCQLFKNKVDNAVKQRHLKIYAINVHEIEAGHELRDIIKYTPSIIIYKEGEIFFMSDPVKNEEYFENNAGFLSLLDKYTNMPTLYYINKTQLDEKIANGEKFVIYYSRSSCGDCSYLNRTYLKEYLGSNNKSNHFYILETDVEGIRYTNGEYDSTLWSNFKDSYGLSDVNNPLGHSVGYVPTLQYYENGRVVDMMVYFNDCEYIENPDGSYSVLINNSYYIDNPYNGQTIAYSDYQTLLSPFYNGKLKEFLDTNLAKVD